MTLLPTLFSLGLGLQECTWFPSYLFSVAQNALKHGDSCLSLPNSSHYRPAPLGPTPSNLFYRWTSFLPLPGKTPRTVGLQLLPTIPCQSPSKTQSLVLAIPTKYKVLLSESYTCDYQLSLHTIYPSLLSKWSVFWGLMRRNSIKVFTIKPDDSGLILGAHMVGKNDSWKLSSNNHTQVMACKCVCNTHTKSKF